MFHYPLESDFKSEHEAAVEVRTACIQVETINTLLQAERIDDLGINLGMRQSSRTEDALRQAVAQ